ncbi:MULTISPECIES: BMP family lipoprotein [Aeromicrobium]|uniref:Basic membrane protein A n=2 Tax=Aeromicrobium tamlense TaxID=375541 RepID=A0ABX2SK29_9ACTN|nr:MULTISPECIES: BMP family ABC transporter substrate-binding protein [Aeromicrobium]NYI39034.1 basic membrane protein A [Aeromicrobium tamlense]
MRRLNKLTAAAAVTALVFAGAGCSKKSTDDESAAGEDCVEKGDIKVGMAFDVGGRGDQSFNDSAAKGLDKAACELGFEVKDAEAQDGEPESAREERLQQLVDAGYNPVVAVGFAYSAAVGKISKANPDVNFAIVDDAVAADNVTNLLFAEEQGSFLVGAAAALKSETGTVGFVGGVDTELIHKFEAGYKAGAKAVNPDIKVQSVYLTTPPDFSGFGDPAKGNTAATGMFEKEADVVYHAAGGSGGGVFQAATDAGKWAIGVDSDQAKTADESVRDSILTSMTKNIDVAVFDFLKGVEAGDIKTGPQVYDLKVDGVGYSTTGGHVDDIKEKLDEYKQQIIDGTITVPSK